MNTILRAICFILFTSHVHGSALNQWAEANPVPIASDIRSEAWWNREQSGWGLFTSVFDDATTAFWYTFDENGKPTWFIFNDLIKGQDGYYTGTLTKHRGVAYNSDVTPGRGVAVEEFAEAKVAYSVGPFDGRQVQNTLDFAVQTRASEQVISHKRVEVFELGTRRIHCRQDASLSRISAANYTDIYWNPDNAGWGLQLLHFESQLVGVWYTYDESGAATFFTMVLRSEDGKSFAGDFYSNPSGVPFTQVSSSIWGSVPSSAVSSSSIRVGEVQIAMSNGQEGIFSFFADGKGSAQRITRYQSGDTANYCEDSNMRGDYWHAEHSLRQRDEIIYFGGYEAGALDNLSWGETAGLGSLPDAVMDSFRSGNATRTEIDGLQGKSLRVRYPAGATWGYGYGTFVDRLGLSEEGYEHLFLRYYFKFEPGWDFGRGGKLPGLAAFQAIGGCVPADGTNGWSMRYMWRQQGRAVLYSYIPHSNFGAIGCGYDFQLQISRPPPLSAINWFFQKETWYCIEQEVKLNDVGQKNGFVKVWINEQQVLDLQGITYRTVDNRETRIGQVVFNTFYGGDETWGPGFETTSLFDNFVLAKSRIGCM